MEKEFVPYELALKLKELGFDECCFKAYRQSHFTLTTGEEDETPFRLYDLLTSNSFYNGWREGECTAPLWQQTFDWFREKGYGAFVETWVNEGVKKFRCI